MVEIDGYVPFNATPPISRIAQRASISTPSNTPPGLSQGAPNRLSNQSNQDLSQRIATFSDQRGEASDLFFLVVLGVAPEFLSMRKKGTKSFPNASCLNELYDDK